MGAWPPNDKRGSTLYEEVVYSVQGGCLFDKRANQIRQVIILKM